MPVERLIPNPQIGFAEANVVAGPGRWVLVSGNVGFDESGVVVDGGLGAEARATFENIRRTLGKLGGQLSDIVKITTFVTDLTNYGEFAEVRSELFGAALPASSTVQVAGLLAGAHIEIEAVAFIPER
jgi:2-iminobutanoate/2-iminopropanoate deaminase